MEFIKKDIVTNVLKVSKYSQLTIDEDFNITDAKKDIDKIIAKTGYIVVEEVVCEEGKIKVSGSVYFKVMYKTVSDKSEIEVYEGEIPFEDYVNSDGVTRLNQANSTCKLEDLTVTMINSRKLEVRGLIGNEISVYEESFANAAVDLENSPGIECQYRNVNMTNTVVSKHDAFRIKEEVEIPQSKPNISCIVWSSVELRNLETKVIDGAVRVRGEVEIFVIYKGKEEHLPLQYLFSVRTVSKDVECDKAVEGMILDGDTVLGKGEIVIRPDADGEDRIIGVDYSVNMYIKLYEDENVRLLNDTYSPQVEIINETRELGYENLIMRNCAKAKISYRKRIGNEDEKLLQLCHIYGNVDIDDVEIIGRDSSTENDTGDSSIHISGVVKTCVMYISASDEPMNCMEVEIPFEYSVEALYSDVNESVDFSEIKSRDSIRIIPSLDQLNVNLLNSEEFEIKAQVNLAISIFVKREIDVITDMVISPIDYKKKEAIPGIVGYVVKEGDTIWSIAKKYYASAASIRKVNNLQTDDIKIGDKLIIIKS